MAYKRTFSFSDNSTNPFNINVALSNPDFQKQMLAKIGQPYQEPQPQANFLQRLLAVPMGLGSIPDAIFHANQGEDFLGTYLKNVSGGVEQALTGNQKLNLKGTNDLLKQAGLLQGEDPLSKVANFGLSFGGDLALDPTTAISFGTTGLAKKAAETVGKDIAVKIGEEGASKLGSEGLMRFTDILASSGVKPASKFLKESGIDGATQIVKDATKDYTPDKVLSFFGKEVARGKPASVVNAVVNPLGAGLGLAGKGLKKVSPNTYDSLTQGFNNLFRADKSAEDKGLSDLYDRTTTYNKDLEGSIRSTLSENGELLNRVKNLSPDIQSNIGHYIEGTLKDPQLLQKIEGDPIVSKTMSDIRNAMKQQGQTLMDNGLLPKTGKYSFDNPQLAEQAKRILEDAGVNIARHNEDLTKGTADLLVKHSESPDIERLLNEELPKTQVFQQMFDKATGDITPFKKSGFLDNYMPNKVMGFNEDYIKNTFGEDLAPYILNDKTVQKAIKKDGYITKEALNEVMTSKSMLSKSPRLSSAASMLDGSNQARTYATRKQGEEAGVIYDKNAARTLGESMVNTDKAIKTKKFAESLKNVMDDSGNPILYSAEDLGGRIPPSCREIRGIEGLNGMYAPKEAHEMLFNYAKNFTTDEGTNNFLKMYDKMMGIFKGSVTSYSPGFIGYNVRNAMGDLNNMLIGGFGARNGIFRISEATHSLKQGMDVLNFEKYMTKFGKEKAVQKYGNDIANFYDATVSHGIVGGTQLNDEVGKRTADLLKPDQNPILKGIKTVADKATFQSTSRMREEGFRVANFIDQYKQTKDWSKAAEKARASSLDYSNLTPFEKNVMKRVIPFYSFARQNIEHQLNTFMSKPGVILGQQKFLNNLGKSMGVSDMSEEDWNALPDWMKTGLSVVTGKNGRKVDVLTGFGDPTSAVNDTASLDPKTFLTNILSMASPAAKIPLEQATGQNFFTGQAIDENGDGTRYKDYPEAVKQFLNFKEIQHAKADGTKYTSYHVDPQKAYLLENLPILAPYNTMTKRVLDVAGKGGDAKYLTNILTGGRIYSKDLDVEQAKKDKVNVEKLDKILTEFGLANPKKGVSLSGATIKDNYPELYKYLNELGYNTKSSTPAKQQASKDKTQQQRDYIKELLNN